MLLRLLFISTIVAAPAWARSSSSFDGLNAVGVDLSVTAGGLAIGADYERSFQDNLGLGGYLHYFGKSTTTGRSANGLLAFGGMASVHYVTGHFDAYAAPGFGFVSVDTYNNGVSNGLTAGPRLGLGLLYQINTNIAVGVEEDSYWSWFNSNFNGLLINDLSVKARMTF